MVQQVNDSSGAPLTAFQVDALRIATDGPEADGTLRWDYTDVVLVRVSSGSTTGLGWTYGASALTGIISGTLQPALENGDAMAIESHWQAMRRAIRNLGRPGVASMAISAVDIALWDLKARLLQLPLVTLLGQAREAVPVYGSGGFTSYDNERLQAQLGGWAESGIGAVKMKVGNRADDAERVAAARAAVGPDVGLMVDANGAYDVRQALRMADVFAAQQVIWYEEPVSSDDLEGLRRVRDGAPPGMEISAGEYGYHADYFRHMLAAGAVDVMQADVTRCSGITGLLRVAALCEAFHVPLSAHCAPALHTHPCCAIDDLRHIEYFHDHVRIENLLFDGLPELRDGALVPDVSRPGHGLELRTAELEKYRV